MPAPAQEAPPEISGEARTDDERYGPVALWRGITRPHPQEGWASLSFQDDGGTVHRFRIPAPGLVALAGALVETIGDQAVRTNSQAANSSGNPARDVSIPFEGENT